MTYVRRRDRNRDTPVPDVLSREGYRHERGPHHVGSNERYDDHAPEPVRARLCNEAREEVPGWECVTDLAVGAPAVRARCPTPIGLRERVFALSGGLAVLGIEARHEGVVGGREEVYRDSLPESESLLDD